MNAPLPAPRTSSTGWARDLGWLLLAFALLFGLRLGSHPLANPDEARYAEIPREMLASGDWVTPRLNGVNYFEKPPLVYWAEAVSLRVFGLNDWAARLPAAAFALGGLALTYAATRRMFGRAAGRWAAVVLGSSLLYFVLARTLLLDGAVSVLMSATLFCFILGVREPVAGGADPGPASARPATRIAGLSRRRWFFYGLYASAALAVLTKGLIGVLLSGLVMFVWLLVFNQWRRLRPLYLPTGIVLFLLIAAPWHLLVAQRNPDWAHFYFVREHWERFTTTTHGRFEPWWYFVPILFVGTFPWMGFLPIAVKRFLAGGWAARKEQADRWYFATWALVIFLFFSKSQSKLIPYILPVLPALAAMLGCYLAELRRNAAARPRLRDGFGLFGLVAVLLGAAFLTVALRPNLVRNVEPIAVLRPYACVLGGVLLLGGVLTGWFAVRRGARAGLGTLLGTVAVMYATLGFAQLHVARPSTRELAEIVTARAQPADRVLHYQDFFHDFTFYAQREVGVIGYHGELEVKEDPRALASGRFIDEAEFRRQWPGPDRLWVVARKRAVGRLFGDPSFRYHLIAETRGHYLFSNQP
ncbi:phospholipid carrier-dependent glycosyltransferase [Opitutus terrae]|uniref:Glycosyl transferase family 39 n=1 Tax=Opitutus terrae (strain DSM 11246 / JCM 15787 / PB90-1) TaxID=452637 RepID=B1ZS18_OPITP|nr:phospholipid carrier-dependent glycosyltransferase [Opitutus terrae]ACB74694.1 glycosyl transferase family 39 [Opitutus terrae PB90-1]